MTKVLNKKNIIIASLILIFIFLISVLLVNFKKLKGTVNKDMLGFKDEMLYYCVLANLFEDINMEEIISKSEDLSYDKYENFLYPDVYKSLFNEFMQIDVIRRVTESQGISITQEQLNTITSLECPMVSDYTGIENLENLESIELYYVDSEKIDLSSNKKLKEVGLEGKGGETNEYTRNDKAKELILPDSLESLDISDFDIETLDISNSNNLNDFYVSSSNLGEIVFPGNTTLSEIHIYETNFSKLDLSEVRNVNYVYINGDNIDNIDLSGISVNANIEIEGNVQNLTLPEGTNQLSDLNITSDKLKTLDLGNFDSIDYIDISAKNLNSMTFKENASIGNLNLGVCNLETLDISNINISNYSYYGYAKTKNFKVKDSLSSLPNFVEEIYFNDESYIKLNNDKVIFADDKFVFKDENLTIGDVSNSNDVIEKKGLDIKFKAEYGCSSNSAFVCTDSDTKLKNISSSGHLKIYKGDTYLTEFEIDVFENENFDDYFLYRQITSGSNNLTDEQLSSKEALSLSGDYITSFKGIEKLTGLKELVIDGFDNFPGDILNNFKNLEVLEIKDSYINTLDTSNLSKLKKLVFYRCNIDNLIVNNNPNLEEISEFRYSGERYPRIKNIKLFENNTNNILRRIDLRNLGLTSIDVSSLTNLEYLNVSGNNIQELDITNNVNLEYLYANGNYLKELDLSKNINLKDLEIYENDIAELDFSNNVNLESMQYEANPLKKLRGAIVDSDTFSYLPNLEEVDNIKCNEYNTELFILSSKLKTIDVSGCKNITTLMVVSDELYEIKGIDQLENLTFLAVISDKIEEIKGISNAKKLKAFAAPFSKINSVDLSNASNLQIANLQFTPATKNSINLLKGTSKELKFKVKFPAQMALEYYNEDDYIAEYDESTNMIKANNIGQTVISTYFLSYNFIVEAEEYELITEALKTYLNVYDIESKKVLINKEYKYIFNYNNETNKVLNRYIKVYGEDVSKKIEGNKLYMYSNEDKIFTFDILEFTSDDYKIDNEKNIIYYSDAFDISKLKVVNGTLNKIDNELQLICNDSIVKTYKLEKK